MKYELKPFDEGDEEYVGRRLEEYNYSVAPPVTEADEDIVFKIEDGDGKIIAGCILEIDRWKIADLDVLWVDEKYRRQGLGSALIREAERTAKEKGCYISVLGTFDFQARPLYEKHGYTLDGTLEWPKGHFNYSLSKRLDRPYKEYFPSKHNPDLKYEIKIGNDDDAKIIGKGLGEYNRSHIPDQREYEAFDRKITDENGRLIAAFTADICEWNDVFINIWVEEPYRNKGVGSYLLSLLEREVKEKGANIILFWRFDWQVGFFEKRGYTVTTVTEDVPKGHRYIGMKKMLDR